MLRRWRLAALWAVCGVLIAAVKFGAGAPTTAAVVLVVFLVLAYLFSPGAFPRPESTADAVADGRPVVYWRPGCPFCLRLRARLGPDAAQLHWVDIWQDPEGAAVVRGITGGDETVPTVVIAGEAHVNPDPAWLHDRLTVPS
ncbi:MULTISPECIES: glutaredoxin domain-containing protein [Actinoplanes]|uniref:glutaredoxin domain-containing protein n=1 Tax=Actinoplanes TaxID=1865 RepID=UPI0005F2D0A2|nr:MULTISPECIES: glutaredoxin domain-containing protein [Actinoplanes]GLY06127.1 membrane protein [Actinoplanes sp. NBRC 101535]